VVRVGDLVYESLYIPRRAESGEIIGVSGVAWEVTLRVRAEEAARLLEAQLLQAQKMETIGTLAGGIAHDFNNILSPILGYAEIALSQLPAGHPVRDDIDQVMKAARRAKELVGQILIFSRRGDEVKRPLQLHLVILEALKLIRSSLPSSIEISQRIDTRNDTVLADPGQMHQVIMNLCTNAAHAMRNGGGVLRVELARETLDAAAAGKISDLKPGTYVVLTVRDQGEGMDEATRVRVFEPFFTTKKPGEGTGLGLSVVHGIVHSHGGAITVESQPGQGATFRAYFPGARRAESAERPEDAVEAGPTGEHILVVDDEPDIAVMLTRMLETRGYRVSAFVSGPEALAAFRRSPAAFDAVISDQTMPRLSGVELAREVHAQRPELPVILTTGYRDRVRSDEFKREIAGVATKPFDAATLIRLLRGALDRH
jgi:signal transduction histidine kinase